MKFNIIKPDNLNSRDMSLVTKDEIGNWFFDGRETYWCFYRGEVVRKIYKRYLPNPMILWRNRCDKESVDIKSKNGKKLKPTEATFKLWEHANASQ